MKKNAKRHGKDKKTAGKENGRAMRATSCQRKN